MSSFLYHGVDISDNSCLPYSYVIEKINEIIDILKREVYVKQAIADKTNDYVGIYAISSDKYLICYIEKGNIFLYKIDDNKTGLLNYTDLENIPFNKMARSVNKYIGGEIRKEIKCSDIITEEKIIRIKTVNNLENNISYFSDLKLTEKGNKLSIERELRDSLKEIKNKPHHYCNNTDNFERWLKNIPQVYLLLPKNRLKYG